MRSTLSRSAVAVVCSIAAAAGAVVLRATRQSAVALSGTGVLTGVLVTDTATPQPVRLATVRLAGATGTSHRLIGTDDAGRFTFAALPAGSYTLSATKPGFVTTFHESRRPGRGPGVPIAIADAARVEVTLRMLPGAAITGTLTNEYGQPAPSVTVLAVEARPRGATAPIRVTTDDRGVYRIFGLAPGDYLVAAVPRLLPYSVGRGMPSGSVSAVTDAEGQWARRLGAPGASAGGAPMPPLGRLVAYAPLFYPGVADLAAASSVTLTAGEERAGVSMSVRIVPVASIAGTIVDAAGQPVTSATVSIYPRRRDRPSIADGLVSSGAIVLPRGVVSPGAFTIAGVAPGEYTIVGRSGSGQRRAATAGAAPDPLWSVIDVAVDGNDRSDLVLRLLPGLKLSGSIVFDSAALAPLKDLSGTEIALVASGSYLGAASTPRAVVTSAGAFRFSGIPPGTYALSVAAPAVPTAGGARWVLKSAVLNGRDLADVPLEVTTSGETIEGLVITFTDRAAQIAGRLLDARGDAVTRYGIVVFSVDRTHWRPGSRRIRLVRPATDGSFLIDGLPPGGYAIAAADDLEQEDLDDARLLTELLAASHELTLAEGERRTQDLKIKHEGR